MVGYSARAGLTGTAIRSGRPAIAKNILNDPNCISWRAEALKWGFFSGIALPLTEADQTYGALNIYAKEPDAFDGDEVKLLLEIANNLSYGIRSLQNKEELEKRRILSLHADRLISLGEMAAGIAHELNQPLQGIRGAAEHMLIGVEKGWNISEERVKEKLKLVISQVDRMSNIIEHVRLFSRESDRSEHKLLNVNAVIKSSLLMIEQQLLSYGIAIKTDFDESLPNVYANAFSLEEVFIKSFVQCPGCNSGAI